ncbi:MAG: hypothetical protein R2694_15645 [Ilumatobacteraceae bacterium]
MRRIDGSGGGPSAAIMMDIADIGGKIRALDGIAADLDAALGPAPGGETAAAARAVKTAVADIERDLSRAAANLRAMNAMLRTRVAYMRKFDAPYPSTFATAADAKRVGDRLAATLLGDGRISPEDLEELGHYANEAEVLAAFFRNAIQKGVPIRFIPSQGATDMLHLLNTATAGGFLSTGRERGRLVDLLDPQSAAYGLSEFLRGEYDGTGRIRPELAAAMFETAIRNNSSDALREVLEHLDVRNLIVHDPATERFLFDEGGLRFWDETVVEDLLRGWSLPTSAQKLAVLVHGVNGPGDRTDQLLNGSKAFQGCPAEIRDLLATLAQPYFNDAGSGGVAQVLADLHDGTGPSHGVTARDIGMFLNNLQRHDDGSASAKQAVDQLLGSAIGRQDTTTPAGRQAVAALAGLWQSALALDGAELARQGPEGTRAAQRRAQSALRMMKTGLSKIGHEVPVLNVVVSIVEKLGKMEEKRLAEVADLNEDAARVRSNQLQRQFINSVLSDLGVRKGTAEYERLLGIFNDASGVDDQINVR